MRRASWLIILAFGALACSPTPSETAQKDGKDGTVVDLDGLKAKAPTSWKEEKPANKMRFAQFRLPTAQDDKDDAELVIFKGLGGSPKANVAAPGRTSSSLPKARRSTMSPRSARSRSATGRRPTATWAAPTNSRPAPSTRSRRRSGGPTTGCSGPPLRRSQGHVPHQADRPGPHGRDYKKSFDDWLTAFKNESGPLTPASSPT